MGCDIHLVLEKRDGDKWVGVDTFMSFHRQYATKGEPMDGYASPIARSRNYDRFAALAGVRGEGPIPRGLPVDASDTTALLSKEWGIDGHSHSWLPMTEAALIWLRTERDPPDMASRWPESHFFNVDCSAGSRNDAANYRVVFWFDN